MVQIRGLEKRPELNGQFGYCLRIDSSKQRWQVKLWGSDEVVLLKASGMLLVVPASDHQEIAILKAVMQSPRP